MDQPRWLAFAWGDLSVAGTPGPGSTARVVRYYAEVGHPEVTDDDVAWCAAFAGACLERAGVPSTRSLMARSYLSWGVPLDDARTGAIAVLSRGYDPRLGHVGFLIGETPSEVILLGGNQGNAVTVAAFPRSRLLGLRWPSPTPAPVSSSAPAPAVASYLQRAPNVEEALFERALAHVLTMEGGYSEDPYDPGGPTNLGITIAEFARNKGVVLDASNYDAVKADLKAISHATAAAIYRNDYWSAAHCPELPAPLAVFHFDAAVNQGVLGAARMLQTAVGADADGEIGPLTLAAVASMPVDDALARYADVRRQHYRSLSTFWRFGRGWLSRVDQMLALARTVAAAMPAAPPPIASTPPSPKEPNLMTDTTQVPTIVPAPAQSTPPTPPAEGKWWGNSMTIWGVFITTLSTVLPVVGPIFGFNITADLIHQLGDSVVEFGQAAGGLIGTVLTVWGRIRATGPLSASNSR